MRHHLSRRFHTSILELPVQKNRRQLSEVFAEWVLAVERAGCQRLYRSKLLSTQREGNSFSEITSIQTADATSLDHDGAPISKILHQYSGDPKIDTPLRSGANNNNHENTPPTLCPGKLRQRRGLPLGRIHGAVLCLSLTRCAAIYAATSE